MGAEGLGHPSVTGRVRVEAIGEKQLLVAGNPGEEIRDESHLVLGGEPRVDLPEMAGVLGAVVVFRDAKPNQKEPAAGRPAFIENLSKDSLSVDSLSTGMEFCQSFPATDSPQPLSGNFTTFS